MSMRSIDIRSSVGLGLIIQYPTGVDIVTQTGGTACLSMHLEGVYLPLQNDYEIPSLKFMSGEIDLNVYFATEKYFGDGATDGIDEEDAKKIESILREKALSFITVDRDKLKVSHEAWIWVKIESNPHYLSFPYNEFPLSGVLTWCNSD